MLLILLAASVYSCNSQTGIGSIEAVSTFSQSIPLTTGWGIWSTFIDPDDTNMTSIFSDIMNDLIIVKDEEGKRLLANVWIKFHWILNKRKRLSS